jgi:hypothetical protein
MICRHTSFSLLFFSHYSLYVIGKAIDPDGVKAFDDDYYLRFTCLYKQYHRDAPALDELQKFSGEEESSSPMACRYQCINNIILYGPPAWVLMMMMMMLLLLMLLLLLLLLLSTSSKERLHS